MQAPGRETASEPVLRFFERCLSWSHISDRRDELPQSPDEGEHGPSYARPAAKRKLPCYTISDAEPEDSEPESIFNDEEDENGLESPTRDTPTFSQLRCASNLSFDFRICG